MNKTILTYKTQNGWEYEYRKVDDMNVAPFGCWKGDTNEDGTPMEINDKEFDSFIDLYIKEDEFYNMSDIEIDNNYNAY